MGHIAKGITRALRSHSGYVAIAYALRCTSLSQSRQGAMIK